MKKEVKTFVKANRSQVLSFQKKYAVAKAAEVIKLFEKMAESDP